MRAQVQPDLSLAHAVDEPAQSRPPRSRRAPCGLLQPHGGQRRGRRAPTPARCSRRLLLLLGLAHRGIRTGRGGHRRGPYGPPMVCLGLGSGGHLHPEARARRGRWGRRRGWTSPPRPPHATGLCQAVRADRMRPPGAGAAAAAAPARRRRARCVGRRRTRTPRGGHGLAVRPDGCGGLGLRGGSGLRGRRRQWAGRHHDQTARCSGAPSIAGLALAPAQPPWPRPAAGGRLRGAPGGARTRGNAGGARPQAARS